MFGNEFTKWEMFTPDDRRGVGIHSKDGTRTAYCVMWAYGVEDGIVHWKTVHGHYDSTEIPSIELTSMIAGMRLDSRFDNAERGILTDALYEAWRFTRMNGIPEHEHDTLCGWEGRVYWRMRDIEDAMLGRKTIRALLVPCGGNPRETRLDHDDDGRDLDSLQGLVGGLIAPFDVLYDDFGGVSLYVNDNGLVEDEPNRAVYATRKMAEAGYLSQLDFSRVVRPGELYAILHGDIVAVGFDPETGENVSLTDEQAGMVERYFTLTSPPDSGAFAEALTSARLYEAARAKGCCKGERPLP